MSPANDNITTERQLAVELPLRYDLFIPPDERTAPRPLLLALHGYGGSKRQMMREAKQLAPDDFVIVAPQGIYQHIREPREQGAPLRYGFGWLTNFHPEESIRLHHDALLRIIAELAAEELIDSRRVFLLGFSQSCALNYRFAFTHADVLRGVVGICGGLPGDWATSAAYKQTTASVLHINGEQDEFYPPERTRDYAAQLGKRATNVEVKNYDAAHEITPAMRDDIRAWLAGQAATKNENQTV